MRNCLHVSKDYKVRRMSKNKNSCRKKQNYGSQIFFSILNYFIKKIHFKDNRIIPVGITVYSMDLEYSWLLKGTSPHYCKWLLLWHILSGSQNCKPHPDFEVITKDFRNAVRGPRTSITFSSPHEVVVKGKGIINRSKLIPDNALPALFPIQKVLDMHFREREMGSDVN